MKKLIKTTVYLTIISCSAVFMTTANASGGGTFFSTKWDADYDVGKKVFFERVTCETCLHSELELNADSISAIMPDLNRDGVIGQQLTLQERKSVKWFVKRQFDI
jgi:hypothetical protein